MTQTHCGMAEVYTSCYTSKYSTYILSGRILTHLMNLREHNTLQYVRLLADKRWIIATEENINEAVSTIVKEEIVERVKGQNTWHYVRFLADKR